MTPSRIQLEPELDIANAAGAVRAVEAHFAVFECPREDWPGAHERCRLPFQPILYAHTGAGAAEATA